MKKLGMSLLLTVSIVTGLFSNSGVATAASKINFSLGKVKLLKQVKGDYDSGAFNTQPEVVKAKKDGLPMVKAVVDQVVQISFNAPKGYTVSWVPSRHLHKSGYGEKVAYKMTRVNATTFKYRARHANKYNDIASEPITFKLTKKGKTYKTTKIRFFTVIETYPQKTKYYNDEILKKYVAYINKVRKEANLPAVSVNKEFGDRATKYAKLAYTLRNDKKKYDKIKAMENELTEKGEGVMVPLIIKVDSSTNIYNPETFFNKNLGTGALLEGGFGLEIGLKFYVGDRSGNIYYSLMFDPIDYKYSEDGKYFYEYNSKTKKITKELIEVDEFEDEYEYDEEIYDENDPRSWGETEE